MNEARWIFCSSKNVFVCRALKAQEPVGLSLEGRDRDGPKTHPAPKLAPVFRYIDKAWPHDRGSAVKSINAFDRGDLALTHLAGPGINGGRLITRVDGKARQPQSGPMCMWPCAIQNRRQFRPSAGMLRTAINDDVINKPACEISAPSPDG